MLVSHVKPVVIWVLRRIKILIVILDEFVDLIEVVRIKMFALYAKVPFDRFSKELRFVPVSCVNTVFVHKLKQEGIEIALLVSHWLIFLTNQQTKVLAPNYNPTEQVVSHRSVLVI